VFYAGSQKSKELRRRWIRRNWRPPVFKPTSPLHSKIPDLQPSAEGPPSGPLTSQSACSKCLGLDHFRKYCRNMVRCKFCYNYGHISISYLSKSHRSRKFRPISRVESEGSCPPSFLHQSSPPPRCLRLLPATPICHIHSGKPQPFSHGELGLRPHPPCSQGLRPR
jgi:hypothetical protein